MNTDLICLDYARLWHYVFDVRRLLWVVPFVLPLLLAGCGKDEEVVMVTEKREFIEEYDADRFEMLVPQEWRRTGNSFPGAAFRSRVLNYQFGDSGGEIYVSIRLGGEVLDNLNRWRGEVGLTEMESVDELEQIPVADTKGYLLEATGNFKGVNPDWTILGVIVDSPLMEMISLKMIGPADDVKANKVSFLKACETLKFIPRSKK